MKASTVSSAVIALSLAAASSALVFLTAIGTLNAEARRAVKRERMRSRTVTQPSAQALQALLDKQAITEVLLGYCRAIDRRDADLMRRVYWPDAIDDHAVFQGNVEEFIAYAFPFMVGVMSQHVITNIWIDLTG